MKLSKSVSLHVMDEEGNRSGYGYDFLRLMARYWDVDYEYVGYDKSWEDMQQMLEDGEIDMVTSARKTPDREERKEKKSLIFHVRSEPIMGF